MTISKEIKVALLGIVAAVVLYFGFMFLKGSDIFSDTDTYYVLYDDVDGLTISNPVILNGIQVGAVQDVRLLPEEGNQIMVELSVMEDLLVGDSTIAALANSDLLGGKAITLYLGNNTELYDGGETLIPYKESSITELISSKSVPVIDKVDTTLARVNNLLDNESREDIHAILENSRQTTAAVAEILQNNQREIRLITSNLAALTASLQQTQRNVNRLTQNLAQITDTLKAAEINQLIANANDAAAELEAAATKINAGQGSLGMLLNDEGLYENLNRSTRSLDLLLRDIQAYPKRYVQFSLFGRKDKYKVDETGRVVSLEEVKEIQEEHPGEFRTVPDTVYVPVPETRLQQGTPRAKARAVPVKAN
ncbi:phospholipid/cholesterol/gamma-HCH transport system substrate-binding protein [Pontibacter ummariensis]|uniref:Phospholipid/cholesterol/gamma-HCH transport system substrate-binding protein n=1 Tax=Pontibacter ummariensis TaxID=1610492 RepID=A0A239BC52_9BACT|nr:MlaD family protein [Pontibacter ummariensis]PRY16459.1 phospholipid/cholesterol/gamma-HCH transport system substrate-binding protein [Pontibacter ummariensis]SNS05526.1 phospholipid/cholesterol/gamma-HCH transport system substrate-binding protein [Pontibacter ummariensis]